MAAIIGGDQAALRGPSAVVAEAADPVGTKLGRSSLKHRNRQRQLHDMSRSQRLPAAMKAHEERDAGGSKSASGSHAFQHPVCEYSSTMLVNNNPKAFPPCNRPPRSSSRVFISRSNHLFPSLASRLVILVVIAAGLETGGSSRASATMLSDTSWAADCQKVSLSDKIEVGWEDAGNLVELHIRHNVQGEVEIRDGDPGSDKVRIEMDKTAATEELLTNFVTNNSIYDIGYGTVFVFQVDYSESSTRTVTIATAAVISALVFLSLMAALVWWYWRQQQRPPFSPVNDEGQAHKVVENVTTTMAEAERCVCAVVDRDDRYDSQSETAVKRANPNGGTLAAPPPPPPRRLTSSYHPPGTSPSKQPPPQITVPANTKVQGMGSPRGLSRTTVVSLSLLTVATLVYASCNNQPRVTMIVFIPPAFDLNAVKLYFNVINDNNVVTKQWTQKNGTVLNVFDLQSAKPTSKPPCNAFGQCENAYQQNLAGCDASTEKCICERGYSLSSGICTDIDECATSQHKCPSTATCRNTIGSYVCQCAYGYYGEERTCKPCSFGCPPGQFEASPCGTSGDRVCIPCTECKGSMYEVRPCGGTRDRQCMHAAHPLLISGEETTPTYLEGLKVEASDNIFMENLHSTRNLETTYYVTDLTQAVDFYWIRESGLRVNIGIMDVNVIPTYEDTDHESDNKYMLGNPNNSEDKTKFRRIVKNYCRHPIPDYYSITLEISRDRITSAQEVVCDSHDPTKPKCPKNYNDGETYLHRTLNEPCQKMGTFPEPLEPAANSIVCTQNTDLLREVYNQTYTTERPIHFEPRRCKSAISRCHQCLSQHRCKMIDIFDQTCCQIDCYTLRDCKQATSDHCTSPPVECAMGDAYRYTIQPVFQNIKQEFQCHIRHRKPKILYKMFYYIMLPERNFETPRVQKTVYAHDLEYQSHGEFIADYITIEHNTGLQIFDEFIMVGRDIDNSGAMNYTVHSMKTDNEFRKKRVTVHEISHNIHIASTQFRSPFDYSTSSWDTNNDCEKDASKFKSMQKHYNPDSQNVKIMMESVEGPFKYFLKSVDNPPYIRFLAPGNTSVLPWYFKDNGPTLITNGSLNATLELVAGGRIWNIILTGRMSDCPGYLGVTINNRIDLEEIYKHDLLIFCPANFSVTFKIPNWGQDPDKTFDVHLEDSRTSYDIYLTHIMFEQHTVERQVDFNEFTSPPIEVGAMLVVISATIAIMVAVLLFVYAYLDCSKKRAMRERQINVYENTNGRAKPGDYCTAAKNLSQGQLLFIILYTLLRMLYTLIFTFTVFFAVLMLFVKMDFLTLSRLPEYQRRKHNDTQQMALRIDTYGQEELLRQAKLVTDMQGACSHYIEELFDSIQLEMDNITSNQHRQDMFGDKSSISYLMNQHVKKAMTEYEHRIHNFTAKYNTRFDGSLGSKFLRYKRYLSKIYDNDWFKFAQLLYNHSNYAIGRSKVFRKANLSGTVVDFSAFLEVEEVEAVQLWPIRFWQRYEIDMPVIPSMPLPKINHRHLRCDLPDGADKFNITSKPRPKTLDSSKFFAPHLPGKSLEGPTFKSTHIDEQYKFLSRSEPTAAPRAVFSIEDFVLSVDTRLLKILFLVLDVLIVAYRLSRTYMTATTLCRGFEESVTLLPGEQLLRKTPPLKEHELQNLRNQAKHSLHSAPTTLPAMHGEAERTSCGGGVAGPGGGGGVGGLHHQAGGYPDHHRADTVDPTLTDYHSATLESQKSMLAPKHINSTPMHPAYIHNDVGVGAGGMGVGGVTGGKVPAQVPVAHLHHHLHHHSTLPPRSWTRRRVETLKQFVGKVLQSSVVPKLLIALVLLVLFYFMVGVVAVICSLDTLEEVDGFRSFLAGLEVQVNQTNWYLQSQAEHFNTVTMKIYETQMRSELLHLESMLQYFNAEQTRLVKNYIAEACTVKRSILGNRPCDITMEPMQLQIPVLPCNFIPIQPQLYTDYKAAAYTSQLGRDFLPFLAAATGILLNTGYAVLIAVGAMLLIHVVGVVLFRFLKTRQQFPVHRVYITSCPPHSVYGGTSGHRHHHHAQVKDYCESDSDDNESAGFKGYAARSRVAGEPDYAKTDTLLSSDFKYTETKV